MIELMCLSLSSRSILISDLDWRSYVGIYVSDVFVVRIMVNVQHTPAGMHIEDVMAVLWPWCLDFLRSEGIDFTHEGGVFTQFAEFAHSLWRDLSHPEEVTDEVSDLAVVAGNHGMMGRDGVETIDLKVKITQLLDVVAVEVLDSGVRGRHCVGGNDWIDGTEGLLRGVFKSKGLKVSFALIIAVALKTTVAVGSGTETVETVSILKAVVIACGGETAPEVILEREVELTSSCVWNDASLSYDAREAIIEKHVGGAIEIDRTPACDGKGLLLESVDGFLSDVHVACKVNVG